ncbi:MAG: hypothetical protein K2L10_02080 [Ruminococcus sp.]|nr:hypothetical protein [Ruminococcus sp.]
MGTGRQYDEKFKLETVKLARETGTKRTAEELAEKMTEIREEEGIEIEIPKERTI